jgi:hypothetical protein
LIGGAAAFIFAPEGFTSIRPGGLFTNCESKKILVWEKKHVKSNENRDCTAVSIGLRDFCLTHPAGSGTTSGWSPNKRTQS